jgi:hypothetical protein
MREHLLPYEAKQKLLGLRIARGVAEDAARSAVNRQSMLAPSDPNNNPMREHLEEIRVRENTRYAHLSRLLSTIDQFMNELKLKPGEQLEMYPTSTVTLAKGESIEQAIDKVRQEIEQQGRLLAQAKLAPLPKDHQKQLIVDYVHALARTARPDVRIVKDEFRVVFKGDMAAAEDVLALVAWSSPDMLTRVLAEELDKVPTRVDALPAAERIRRVAEIESTLLDLSRREESLIMLAAGTVERRVDASPLAVLQIQIAAAKEAAA